MNNKYPIIVKFENEVFIANQSDYNIKKLVYSTKAMLFLDDDLVHTDRPFYQIDNLNSNAMVKIEDVDPMEDDTILYFLEEIEFDGVDNLDFKPNLLTEKTYHKKTFFNESNEPPFSTENYKITKIKIIPDYVQKEKENSNEE